MRDIKGTTKMCALIGNPTAHSLSPLIHNSLVYFTEKDAAYTTFSVEENNLEDAIRGAFALGIVGMNVTVPYKTEVMKYLVGTDRFASAIGAVNTLVRKDDGYYGYNTDSLGFIRALAEERVFLKNREVVVLGAGGAARAICFAAALKGAAKIYILNRTLDNALKIAKDINYFFHFKENDRIICRELSNSEDIDVSDHILVQTTNVGMNTEENEIIPKESVLFKNAYFGMDIIYNPSETMFLKNLKNYNVKCINGLPMLLYQGIESYKKWFDCIVTKDMEKIILNKLNDNLNDDTDFPNKNIRRRNIILTGFMGSGKTTLAKWISKHTGRTLIDTDKEIENLHGCKIKEIFEKKGEKYFREIENEYLKDLADSKRYNMVIAVGGGTPLIKENRDVLKRIGTVVYLKATPDELAKRLRYDVKRPLLMGKTGDERKEFVEEMIKIREPFYMDGAHIVVNTNDVYFPRIYQIIERKINSYNKRKKSAYNGKNRDNNFALRYDKQTSANNGSGNCYQHSGYNTGKYDKNRSWTNNNRNNKNKTYTQKNSIIKRHQNRGEFNEGTGN